MLIIFDLDDTLIDTLGSITPQKLKKAVEKMEVLGLRLKNKELELNSLLKFDQTSPSCKLSVEKFLEKYDKKKYLSIALQEIYNELDPSIKILPQKNALKILKDLRKRHLLALVTVGEKDIQYTKLKNAGIDCSLFSIIDVVKEGKGPSYKKIIDTLKAKPEKTLVIGDKVEGDLLPAKKLDCITVFVKKGRGKNIVSDRSFVDYEIEELEEIKKIIGEEYGDK